METDGNFSSVFSELIETVQTIGGGGELVQITRARRSGMGPRGQTILHMFLSLSVVLFYMTTVQINHFRPRTSHSATEPLLGGPKFFFYRGPNPLLVALDSNRHLKKWNIITQKVTEIRVPWEKGGMNFWSRNRHNCLVQEVKIKNWEQEEESIHWYEVPKEERKYKTYCISIRTYLRSLK
jgi:hypothetical protein